jgi:excisionase family DNA binding protein
VDRDLEAALARYGGPMPCVKLLADLAAENQKLRNDASNRKFAEEHGVTYGVKKYLTVPEVAETLKVSHQHVYNMMNGPRGLASIKIGRSRRIPVEALEAYLAGSQ